LINERRDSLSRGKPLEGSRQGRGPKLNELLRFR
jgi:hypothetical protein